MRCPAALLSLSRTQPGSGLAERKGGALLCSLLCAAVSCCSPQRPGLAHASGPAPGAAHRALRRQGRLVTGHCGPSWLRGLSVGVRRAAQAVCLVVRNQHADIREWLEHHIALGVGRFYVFDNNSTRPMLDTVLDLVQAGTVDYQYLTGYQHHSNRRALPAGLLRDAHSHPRLCCGRAPQSGCEGRPRLNRRTQLYVYDTCIQQYRARHHWMAFIDADEFFVLRDAHVPDLPALLAEYEHFGALAVNWQARRPRRPHLVFVTGCAGLPCVLGARALQLAAHDPCGVRRRPSRSHSKPAVHACRLATCTWRQ